MPRLRKYSYKDAEMLKASKAIIIALEEQLSELSAIRTNWNEEFVAEMNEKIDANLEILDSKTAIQKASETVKSLQNDVLQAVSLLKTQIEVDFPKKEQKELFDNLGFKQYLKPASLQDDYATTQLLYQFDNAMTDELKQRIVEKGTAPAIIEKIQGYAAILREKKILPETFDKSNKNLSRETIEELNDIYETVQGICKISSRFYQKNKALKNRFVFSKVHKNLENN